MADMCHLFLSALLWTYIKHTYKCYDYHTYKYGWGQYTSTLAGTTVAAVCRHSNLRDLDKHPESSQSASGLAFVYRYRCIGRYGHTLTAGPSISVASDRSFRYLAIIL
ncbi:hypothetical protein QTP88_003843 [Uroleucon formosanum]